MRKLLDLAVQLAQGLTTKFRRSETATASLVRSENADGFDIFRAYGKMPGSQSVVTVASGTEYKSLHYHEYTTLSGTTGREVLAMRSGSLIGIENGAASIKQAGLVSEALTGVTTNDRFFFTSSANDPKKYDGFQVTNWGVTPPGSQETVIHAINSTSGWTVSGTGNVLANSSVSKDALGSLSISKGETSTAFVTAITVSGAYNFDASGDNVNYWVFVPPEAYSVARSTAHCLELVLGSGSPPFWASKTYTTELGELAEGWNLITEDLTAPDGSTNTLSLAGVKDIGFRFHTTAVGNTFNGLLVDKLYLTDDGDPTPAIGSSGNVSGTVTYGVTFVSRYGQRSNLGPSSSGVEVAGKQVLLTNIPVSSDSQVIKREIWRDLAGDALHRKVDEINDNTTTTFTDNVAPASLESTTAPLAGDLSDDNSVPPRMTSVKVWNNHLFGINAGSPNSLEVAVASEPESWPIVNTRIFERELTAIEGHSDSLFIYSSDRTWTLTGDSNADFVVVEQNPDIGCSGPRAVVNVKGEVIAWHDTGPYLWLSTRTSNQKTPWFLGNPIKDIIEALDPEGFRDMRIEHDRGRLRLVFFLQSEASGDYDTILAYNYGHGHAGQVTVEGSVDPHDLRQGTWTKIKLPASVNATASATVERSTDEPELWIGTDDGNAYQIQKPGVYRYARTPTQSAAAIETIIQTNVFPLAPTPDQFGKARYLTFNCTATSSGTLGVTYDTRASEIGPVLTTTGINVYYPAGDSSPRVSIPQAGRHGNFGQLMITNSGIDEDFTISDVKLKLLPTFDRGLRSS